VRPERPLGFLPALGEGFFEERPWAFVEARVHSRLSLKRIRSWRWLYRRMRVVHLPYSHRGERLNVADTDAAVRRKSIRVIVEAIRALSELPVLEKYVLHPVSLQLWDGKKRGEYRAAVEGLREILERAGKWLRGPVCLENNRVYYPAGRGPRTNRIFADNPGEWCRLQEDVAHPLLALCLDTSHAVTSALLHPRRRRDRVLRAFLACAQRVSHVHWSANFPYDRRGRADSHAPLGTPGTQRLWFHRMVAALPASVTIEIPDREGVEKTLRYLRRYRLWRPPAS